MVTLYKALGQWLERIMGNFPLQCYSKRLSLKDNLKEEHWQHIIRREATKRPTHLDTPTQPGKPVGIDTPAL